MYGSVLLVIVWWYCLVVKGRLNFGVVFLDVVGVLEVIVVSF